MRSGSSKYPLASHPLPTGTATRLTTSIRQRLTTGAATGSSSNVCALNTELNIENRPITAQGLKTAPKGPQRRCRQVEDRAYFIGVLRGHINAISSELSSILAQHEAAEKDAQSYVQYEKMAEALAAELRAFQGELGDYNTLVDRTTLGHDISTIELDLEHTKAANERAELTLARLFEEHKNKEALLKTLESEFEKETRAADSVVKQFDDQQKTVFSKLKDLNDRLLERLSLGKNKIRQMSARKSDLEAEITTSKLKQEAMRLMGKLRELALKKDQLENEDKTKEDPQMESKRLLDQVKKDNRETANMEREIRDLTDKNRSAESALQELTIQLTDDCSFEFVELQRRENQINSFLTTFETAKLEEEEGIALMETQILRLLQSCSQIVVNTEQTDKFEGGKGEAISVEAVADQLSVKAKESNKSANTIEALTLERARLERDLQKIDRLEGNMNQELQTLNQSVASMESDLKKFDDLISIGEATEEKKAELIVELKQLQERRENLITVNTQKMTICNDIETQLSLDDKHLQLRALEAQLVASEQARWTLAEGVAEKRASSTFAPIAERATCLLKDYNENLKIALKVKPVGM